MCQDASKSLHGTCAFRALRPRLDGVKWLRSISRHNAHHCSIREIRNRALGYIPAIVEILQDIVSPHSKIRRGCLLEDSTGKAAVESQDTIWS